MSTPSGANKVSSRYTSEYFDALRTRPKRKRYQKGRHSPPNWSTYEARYKPASIRQHLGATDLYPSDAIDRWRKEAGHAKRNGSGPLGWPSVNGPNDPLSIMLVLDCIMRLETASYIQAGALTGLLASHYSHVVWDPVNVGKILSGLFEITADAAPDKDDLPLERTVWGGAIMYGVSESPEAWKYLGALRDALGHIVTKQTKLARKEQGIPVRDSTIWDVIGQVAWKDRAS